MRASNAPKTALTIISHIRLVFAPTVVNFVTAKAPEFNRVQQAGRKRFNKNHLESTEFYRVQQGLASGSGPGGRWVKSTRPDQLFSMTYAVQHGPKLSPLVSAQVF